MNGVSVDLIKLPSRGLAYPKDIELFIKPLTVKEQIDTERYGISDSEYFRSILRGITIEGNFNRNDLLHSDVQFLDIVRRLITFDTNSKITIKDCECTYRDCNSKFDFSFNIDDLTFTDFSEDIFGKHFVFGEGTEDELEVEVSPVTVQEYINMSNSFRGIKNKKEALSEMYTSYMCLCIRDVVGRSFKDTKDRNSFLRNYIENLYMAKDKKVLKQIIDETIVKLEPFRVICDDCGREVEVSITPDSNFQQ